MTTVPVIVDSRLRIGPVSPEARRLIEPLRDALTAHALNGIAARFRRHRGSDETETRCLLRADGNDRYSCPRGAVAQLRQVAHRVDIELVWDSRVVGHDLAPRAPLADMGVTLRPYQTIAAQAMVDRVQGVVVSPAGSGKSTIGAAALGVLNQAALVVVPTAEVMEQWVGHLERMYEPKVRRLGDGYHDRSAVRPHEVVVAIADSLDGDESLPILESVAVLICDEAHRISGERWSNILDRCPARWRWFLTATPYRADGWESLFPILAGPVIHRTTVEELVAGGWLHRPRVIGLRTGVDPDEVEHRRWAATCACGWEQPVDLDAARMLLAGGSMPCVRPKFVHGRRVMGAPVCPRAVTAESLKGTFDHPSSSRDLALVPGRVAALAEVLRWAYQDGRRSLVLLPTRQACDALHRACERKGVPSRVVVSGAPGRASSVAAFRLGIVRCVIATNLADEGLDVPEVDLLVQGIPGRAKRGTVQRAGRSMRPAGKQPIVIDLVDGGAHERQWRERVRQYRDELGVEPESMDAVELLATLWGLTVRSAA